MCQHTEAIIEEEEHLFSFVAMAEGLDKFNKSMICVEP